MPRRNQQKTGKGPCAVPACDNEAHTLGLCKTCYNRTYYWHRKSLKEKMHRISRLKVWESSLELQMGTENVVQLGRKRRKAG